VRALDATELLALAAQAAQGGDLDGAVTHLATAVRRLTEAGDRRAAALTATRLGELYQQGLGNKVAARPWFLRAQRLVDAEEPCVEQGWVALAELGCEVDDPDVLRARAERALHLARRFDDVDLELKALADGGLALVQVGRVEEGMAMIDEAMALACGGAATDKDAIGKSVCSFYTACYHTADFDRMASWSRAFGQRGLLGPSPGMQAFLSSHCDSVRAILLCHLGRWGEAEEVLTGAYDAIEAAMPGAAWHPPIALAELRILQGRLAEAEALLLGRDHQIQALVPMARLHLARRDHDLAAATARRGLRMLGADRLRAAALLGVLVEANLGRQDREAASRAADQLDERVTNVGLPALLAEARRLRARIHLADGDLEAAAAQLQAALAGIADGDLELARLTLHVELARVLEDAGDPAGAAVEAGMAGALLHQMDVVLPARDVDLLERLGSVARTRTREAACRVATLAVEGGWYSARCGDTTVRLRRTKGLRYLVELLAHPGSERHALDLVDLVEGQDVDQSGLDRRRLGDAGELLDARARAAYRRRIVELQDQVEDALVIEADDRAAAAQTELDALVGELARAVGLGGRDRRASSVAEKARLNVTRALRSAIAATAAALPEAGAALDRRIRTGTFCAYEPHPDDELVWTVHRGLNGGPPS
jgi:hypothetical protein